MIRAILGGLFCICVSNLAQAKQACEGVFPKNNLWIPASHLDSGISEANYNAVLDKLTAIYSPVAQAQGYGLVFNRLWDDGTVNSDTDIEGTDWVVNSYGVLARYNGMTSDAYAAVACHELGHHLGGAPLFTGDDWASVEGEADYHATTKCLRKYFANDDNLSIVKDMQIDPTVTAKCSADFSGDANLIAICKRSASAGYVLADILRQLSNVNAIAFNTPDPSQVSVTFEDHPAAQCRLDTYFQGALCVVSSDVPFDKNDYKVGACVTQTDGPRPACWFKAN